MDPFIVRSAVVAHVSKCLKLDIRRARHQFPCSSPVSCDKDFLCEFANGGPVSCAFKLDGVRAFLVVVHLKGYDILCAYDRSWTGRVVARAKADRDHDGVIHVVDCENVEGVLYAHDVIIFEEAAVLSKPFETRVRMYRAATEDISSSFDADLKVVNKDFVPVKEFLGKTQPRWTREDGIIFVHANAKSTIGTDFHVMKWKPAERNTLDCQIAKNVAYVIDGNRLFRVKNCEIKRAASDGIFEMTPVVKAMGVKWQLGKHRPDKSAPNCRRTYELTLKAVLDNVTMETLVGAFCMSA